MKLDDLQAVAAELVTIMADKGYLRNCLNCDKFDQERELCTHAEINKRPPARIIVTGCEEHSDFVPF